MTELKEKDIKTVEKYLRKYDPMNAYLDAVRKLTNLDKGSSEIISAIHVLLDNYKEAMRKKPGSEDNLKEYLGLIEKAVIIDKLLDKMTERTLTALTDVRESLGTIFPPLGSMAEIMGVDPVEILEGLHDVDFDDPNALKAWKEGYDKATSNLEKIEALVEKAQNEEEPSEDLSEDDSEELEELVEAIVKALDGIVLKGEPHKENEEKATPDEPSCKRCCACDKEEEEPTVSTGMAIHLRFPHDSNGKTFLDMITDNGGSYCLVLERDVDEEGTEGIVIKVGKIATRSGDFQVLKVSNASKDVCYSVPIPELKNLVE